jgi:hypothetical protein
MHAQFDCQTAPCCAGILVGDAAEAYKISTESGAIGVLPPVVLRDKKSNTSMVVSEIQACGDVVFRWISGNYAGPFLPTYHAVEAPVISFGFDRIDHVAVCVPDLFEVVDYVQRVTGSCS